ncbi:MAG TPA: tryptophan 2,3-dioxygenase, partial [Candidatus Poseidoniia archaeon]|nr:tryptophan 2,3-dioxygenase [Candidatus Poseidoniia archaeon]
MPPSYSEYLQLDELLALQEGTDGKPSSDELHFILVHQNFELWFKLVISELRAARDILDRDYVAEERIPRAVHHL